MDFSKEELVIINETLFMAKNVFETEGFLNEKRILDSICVSDEKAELILQKMYTELQKKIQDANKDMNLDN